MGSPVRWGGIGFTLGLSGHAIGLDCGDQIVSAECLLAPYANPFSIMGAYIYGTHQDVRGKLAMNLVVTCRLVFFGVSAIVKPF